MIGRKGKGKGPAPGYRPPTYPMPPDVYNGPNLRIIWAGVAIVVCLVAAAIAWWPA